MRSEITPVDSTVEILDDGQDARSFLIKDRDGMDKVLVVDKDNFAETYDSWRLAWEREDQPKENSR